MGGKSQILCFCGGFQSGSEAEYSVYFCPFTSHWRSSVRLSLSACPHIILTWNPPNTGWNKIPDRFLPHVISVPLAVEYGSVSTSNQLHRLCVTLGEVKAHMWPADSPSPWSQNDYGHGPSFICFLSYKNKGDKLTSSFYGIVFWQMERGGGGRRAVFLRHPHVSSGELNKMSYNWVAIRKKQGVSLSCWCVGKSQGIRVGEREHRGMRDKEGKNMNKAFKGMEKRTALLQLKESDVYMRQFKLKRWNATTFR